MAVSIQGIVPAKGPFQRQAHHPSQATDKYKTLFTVKSISASRNDAAEDASETGITSRMRSYLHGALDCNKIKSKVRVIDDGKARGLNQACGLSEKFSLHDVDAVAGTLFEIIAKANGKTWEGSWPGQRTNFIFFTQKTASA